MITRNKNIITMAVMTILFLLPELCFAADSPAIYSPNDFLKPTDVSLQLLSNIFGMIPGISQFIMNKKTVISALFYALNWGLFGCSGIFLCYTTIKLIADMNLESGQMKNGVSSMWTVLRVVCGVGLLIPTESGYSTINTVVMWVILQSIGLANWTWYNVTTGFENNVGISTGSAASGSDSSQKDIDDLIDSNSNPTKVGVVDILRSLVCAETIKLALSKIPTQQKDNIDATLTNRLQTYNCDSGQCTLPYLQTSGDNPDNSELFAALFPGYTIKTSSKKTALVNPINKFKVSDLNGICGSFGVTVAANSDNKDNDKKEGITNLQQTLGSLNTEAKRLLSVATSKEDNALDAINPLKYTIATKDNKIIKMVTANTVVNMPPDASDYVGKYNSNQDKLFSNNASVNELKTDLLSLKIPQTAQELAEAAASYYQANALTRTTENVNKTKETETAKQEQLDQGWAVAGSYYRFINQQIEKEAGAQQACTIIDAKLKPGDKAKEREAYPAYSLFTFKDSTTETNNVAFLLKSIDESALGTSIKDIKSSDSYTYFMNTMPWLRYTPDYAKILKANLTPDFTASLEANNAIEDIKLGVNDKINQTYSMTGLKALEGTAVGLLCIPLVGSAAISILAWLPSEFMNFHLDIIMDEWEKVMDNSKESAIIINGKGIQAVDPISKLQLLGHVMVEESLNYFTDVKTLLISIGSAYGVSSIGTALTSMLLSPGSFFGATTGGVIWTSTLNNISSNMESITRALVNADMAMGMAIFLPLLVVGLTLTIYVPLIPYMLFFFGVISWLISVICLMLAAPIICFLMLWSAASQENPLLSKEAELFVMQLLAAFLRPTLMIAGLVVGIILATVSIDLLNYGFGAVFQNSVNSSSETTVIDIIQIESLGGIVVYTFIMISVVNMCFSTIHVLYTEVMRLVQIQVGSVNGAEAETQMQQVKQGSESIAHAAGSGAKDSAGALKDIKASSTAGKERYGKDGKRTDIVETKAPPVINAGPGP